MRAPNVGRNTVTKDDPLNIGDFLVINDIRVKVVAFRDKVKGALIYDRPARYTVFVEQSGDYRMGTIRTDSV